MLSEKAKDQNVEDVRPLVDATSLTDCSSPAIAAAAVQAQAARSGTVAWSTKDWNSDWNNRRT